MGKSEAGKGDSRRPCCVSGEELELRKAFAWGELKISEVEMRKKLDKIRKKYGLKL